VEHEPVVHEHGNERLATDRDDGAAIVGGDVDPLDRDALVPCGERDPLDVGGEGDPVDLHQRCTKTSDSDFLAMSGTAAPGAG
jgi:hypothetical protein